MSLTPPQKKPGISLENIVFYISLAALALTAGTFFYLQSAVSKGEAELESLTIEASKTKTADQKKLEDSILKTQQELRDFSKLIAARKASSQLYSKTEEMVVLGVYFYKFDLDVANMTGVISGHAKNFEILGQQIIRLQEAKDILGSVSMANANISEEGGIDFELKVKFNDNVAIPQYGG